MKIGYARVSAKWYQSEFQLSELEKQGCDKVWKETLFDNENSDRSLNEFLEQISEGDTVVATRLTSIAQTTADLLMFLEKIQKKGAFFKSLAEPWADTTSKNGLNVIETIRGILDFEIAVADVESRTDENRPKTFGLSAGRPNKLSKQKRFEAISLLRIGKTAAEIGRMLGVSRSTISRIKSDNRSDSKKGKK